MPAHEVVPQQSEQDSDQGPDLPLRVERRLCGRQHHHGPHPPPAHEDRGLARPPGVFEKYPGHGVSVCGGGSGRARRDGGVRGTDGPKISPAHHAKQGWNPLDQSGFHPCFVFLISQYFTKFSDTAQTDPARNGCIPDPPYRRTKNRISYITRWRGCSSHKRPGGSLSPVFHGKTQ